KTSGLLSIFFMAFTLVLVSFSCTGPIIGTLLVEASTQGGLLGPTLGMSGFALALALPFTLFAIFPNIMQSMPRSGGWLQTFKVVLGFLELALSLKFLSVADMAYSWGILPREVFIILWIIIAISLGLYLLNVIRFPHDEKVDKLSWIRISGAVVSFLFAAYMIPGVLGAPTKAISAFTPPMSTQHIHVFSSHVEPDFYSYEEGMLAAQAQNKKVLIDFSGYGCVNCRKMENAVWTDTRVKAKLEKDFVLISLMVDDKTALENMVSIEENGQTRKLRSIGDKWSYLQRYKFGANAQPFYLILTPEGRPLTHAYAFNDDPKDFLDYLNSVE
ncbi:MAG: thioredoxin family protein, partial [Bacteroidales bacterium]|nr:thioredoxin family protein [Bacteroidales bacterium]